MRLQMISRLLWDCVVSGADRRGPRPQWAAKMYDKLDQDFGTVPAGADLKARIRSQQVSADGAHRGGLFWLGCTDRQDPAKDTLASDEFDILEVTMDARKFTHLRTFSIVTFDQPLFTQVRIPVKAYITRHAAEPRRGEFGGVAKGTDVCRRIASVRLARPGPQRGGLQNPHWREKLVERSVATRGLSITSCT